MSNHGTRWTAVLVLAVALVLSSFLVAQAAFVIHNEGTVWKPKTANVATGTTVKWRITSGTHTVTAYGGNWSKNVKLAAGQSTNRTFSTAGTYKFRCKFHSTLTNGVCSGMCGKVVVA